MSQESSEEMFARILAETEARLERERQERAPLVEFMRKLAARQGTITPDFGALYKKKAELDEKLRGDDSP